MGIKVLGSRPHLRVYGDYDLYTLQSPCSIMGNTIRHMFEGVRPFDWLMLVIEILVLLAILYFEGVGEWRYRKMRKRVAALVPFMDRGQELQHSVPEPSHPTHPSYSAAAKQIEEWMNSIDVWGKETRQFLEQYSPRAARVFENIAETGILANPQTVHTESGRSFPIEGPQRESYLRLVAQLNNLRSIMEKPEAYF